MEYKSDVVMRIPQGKVMHDHVHVKILEIYSNNLIVVFKLLIAEGVCLFKFSHYLKLSLIIWVCSQKSFPSSNHWLSSLSLSSPFFLNFKFDHNPLSPLNINMWLHFLLHIGFCFDNINGFLNNNILPGITKFMVFILLVTL